MKYVCVDKDGRIQSVTDVKEFAGPNAFEFTFPEDFDFGVQNDYKIENNELIYDPAPLSEEEKQFKKQIEFQKQLQTATVMFVNNFSSNITDEQALSMPLVFEEWKAGINYKKDYIVRYNEVLYRIGQDHTSQTQWVPGAEGTTALYSQITISEEGYEEWKAWDGVSGIYAKDQVIKDPEDNQLYKSKIPNNVYGPPHSNLNFWELYYVS